MLRPGNSLRIETVKADGTVYRSWPATVEWVENGLVRTVTPAGTAVTTARGRWISPWAGRAFYWLDRPYNLIEIYTPAGELDELYVHIASRPAIDGAVLRYADYELDVVCKPGGEPSVVDQDEFAQAAAAYGYTVEFQAACHAAAAEAAALLACWIPGGMPGFPSPHGREGA